MILDIARDRRKILTKEKKMKNKGKSNNSNKFLFYFYFFQKKLYIVWKHFGKKLVFTILFILHFFTLQVWKSVMKDQRRPTVT